jgi:cysteine synthase
MKTDAATPEKTSMRRRDVLRALGLGAGAAVAASAPLVEQAAADSETNAEKVKARYQANSADVQNYYRVNRYPK